MLFLASIHFQFRFDLRADLLAFAAALVVVLCVSLFTNWSEHIENGAIRALTRMMNHRRWFTFWLIGFFLWAAIRSAIIGSIDWDLIIITGAWSFWPFTVENIVKVTQGQTLNEIAALASEIKQQNDRTAERDEKSELTLNVLAKLTQANTHALQRVLDALEDIQQEGGEPASV